MGEAASDALADEEPVESAQGAEAQLDGRPAQLVPPQETHVAAEIVALEALPGRRLLPLFLVPGTKLAHGLTVIALRVDRSAAIGRQVLEETLNPLVFERWWWRWRGFSHSLPG